MMTLIRAGLVGVVLFAAAAVVTAAEDKLAATSQPQDDQTFLSLVIVEFTPNSPTVTAAAIKRQLRAASASANIPKVLEKLGRAEVLSRPNVLTRWPGQPATITVGEQVPVLKDGKIGYEDVGLKISLDGEWLRIDDERAFVKGDIEYSHLDKSRAAASQPAPSIARKDFLRERIVTAGETSWLILPLDTVEKTGTRCIIGLKVHRIGKPFDGDGQPASDGTSRHSYDGE